MLRAKPALLGKKKACFSSRARGWRRGRGLLLFTSSRARRQRQWSTPQLWTSRLWTPHLLREQSSALHGCGDLGQGRRQSRGGDDTPRLCNGGEKEGGSGGTPRQCTPHLLLEGGGRRHSTAVQWRREGAMVRSHRARSREKGILEGTRFDFFGNLRGRRRIFWEDVLSFLIFLI